MYKGIDVSKHNGAIDWEKVKATGIDFAIIRVGHGSDISTQDDQQAARNMDECERLSIPYGIYLYSYALTIKEAESEAAHVLRMIKGRNPKVGIWFDMEDADGYKSKNGIPLDTAHSKLYTNICATFTTEIQVAGYKNVGIYASKSVLDNIIGKEYLQYGNIKVWVAQWAEKCTYNGKYILWQYSDAGKVDGISSARVDMDYYYGEFENNYDINSKEESATNNNRQQVAQQSIQLPETAKYNIGQKVRVSSYYASSTETDSSKAVIKNAIGTITKIIPNAHNPYLLDNGNIGWCNDGDIRELLNDTYYEKYTGISSSIVDALQSLKVDSSFSNRKKIAEKNGITNYTGTAPQNTKLLSLLKQGKLIK